MGSSVPLSVAGQQSLLVCAIQPSAGRKQLNINSSVVSQRDSLPTHELTGKNSVTQGAGMTMGCLHRGTSRSAKQSHPGFPFGLLKQIPLRN